MKSMPRSMVRGLFLVAFLAIGPVAFAQGSEEAEKGSHSVFGDIRQAAKDVAGDIQQGYEKVRDSVRRMGVATRIYARLHWDKGLAGASVSIDVNRDGQAVLRGTVPSEKAKQKAESLTLDTVGVEHVANYLMVAPAADAAPAR
jgi:hyperosmotically inducible periplasmic protein